MTRSGSIVHFLYEPGDGGLDRVAIYLANGMAKRGIRTELWLTKATGPLEEAITPEVKVRMVPTPQIGNRGVRLFLQIPALAKMIREHRPRAIFSAGNQSNLSIAIARKLAGRVPTKIIQKITNPIKRPNMNRWTVAIRRWRFGMTVRQSDLCLTLSEPDARSYAVMFPKASDRLRAVYNAYVTPEMLSAGDNRLPRDPSKSPSLLAVGRFMVQKDYANMMQALALIKDRAWTLTILGDGPLMQETRFLAENLGIGNRIDFKGFVLDATPYYAESELLILSSKWEGFAAVPLEAMAAGCRVAATDSSAGLTYLLAEKGQKTVPINDPAALADAISGALDEPIPPDSLRETAASYSIENSIDDHLRLLETVEISS